MQRCGNTGCELDRVQHAGPGPRCSAAADGFGGAGTGVRVPPSLVNIYKELAADVGTAVPNHGCLENVGCDLVASAWWCQPDNTAAASALAS